VVVTNTSDSWGYAGYDAPAGTYGWYPSEAGDSGERQSGIGRALWMVVAVTGAATFVVSLASPVLLGFAVRMPVLAAAVAAVGLLPRQAGHGWIVVALTIAGFLDALATWITADPHSWTLTVITVLNALQFLVAMGALLHETTVVQSADADSGPGYSAYATLAAAYQQAYATQYQKPPTDVSGGGHADAAARADGVATEAAARDFSVALQARYAQYGEYPAGQQPYGSTEAPQVASVADPGIPGTNSGVPQSQPHLGRPDEPGMFHRADGT
jgi:hypothetical protein